MVISVITLWPHHWISRLPSSGSVKPQTLRQRSGSGGPRVDSPGATVPGQWEARIHTLLQNWAFVKLHACKPVHHKESPGFASEIKDRVVQIFWAEICHVFEELNLINNIGILKSLSEQKLCPKYLQFFKIIFSLTSDITICSSLSKIVECD